MKIFEITDGENCRENDKNHCYWLIGWCVVMKYCYEDTFDYANGFYLTSAVYRIGNMLAHCELYKRILHLPRDVIEFDVFKSVSLIQFSSFRELLKNKKREKFLALTRLTIFRWTLL